MIPVYEPLVKSKPALVGTFEVYVRVDVDKSVYTFVSVNEVDKVLVWIFSTTLGLHFVTDSTEVRGTTTVIVETIQSEEGASVIGPESSQVGSGAVVVGNVVAGPSVAGLVGVVWVSGCVC